MNKQIVKAMVVVGIAIAGFVGGCAVLYVGMTRADERRERDAEFTATVAETDRLIARLHRLNADLESHRDAGPAR